MKKSHFTAFECVSFSELTPFNRFFFYSRFNRRNTSEKPGSKESDSTNGTQGVLTRLMKTTD